LRAVHVEYRANFQNRPILDTLIEECAAALYKAAILKPLVVLDGGPASIFANHRRNLDAYINEARQKMYSIREELEKSYGSDRVCPDWVGNTHGSEHQTRELPRARRGLVPSVSTSAPSRNSASVNQESVRLCRGRHAACSPKQQRCVGICRV